LLFFDVKYKKPVDNIKELEKKDFFKIILNHLVNRKKQKKGK